MLRPDRELDWIRPLEPPVKVEGIEAHRAGSDLDLLMVADPDDPGFARAAARRAPVAPNGEGGPRRGPPSVLVAYAVCITEST